ncbi:MAG: hypothetical protein KDE53_25470, partial [Caldilineaceae bacterium]|nr:hypothetical protein [Caldilineaceae bacterium]
YWRNQDYLGIGPGAHSHLRLRTAQSGSLALSTLPQAGQLTQQREYRWGNRKPVPGYVKRIERGEPVEEFREEINTRLAMGETMMLGLRLLQEGVEFQQFKARHGVDLREVFAEEIANLQSWNLIALDEERVTLTQRGLLLGNQVFSYFLPEE